MTAKMTDDMGGIISASGTHIAFENGVNLEPNQMVYLPDAAGGGLGTVDFIRMVFDPQELRTEICLRIEDEEGQGHLFVFPA